MWRRIGELRRLVRALLLLRRRRRRALLGRRREEVARHGELTRVRVRVGVKVGEVVRHGAAQYIYVATMSAGGGSTNSVILCG